MAGFRSYSYSVSLNHVTVQATEMERLRFIEIFPQVRERSGRSGRAKPLTLEPLSRVDSDEIFRPGSSCQIQPQRAMFPIETQSNIKERTAKSLLNAPFGQ